MDDELVTNNHRLTSQGVSAIPQILKEPYYRDAMGYSYEYRPVVLISYAIEHTFFGDNPHVSHFGNVFLFSLLCVLIFVCLSVLFNQFGALIPFLASILFAVHPIHTEVVDSIKNRDEILALMAGFGALYFALKYIDQSKWWNLLGVIVFYTVSLLSKQSTMSLALIMPLAIVLFRNASLVQLTLVQTAFVIPASVLAPLETVKMRMLFFIGAFVFNFFIYAIVNNGANFRMGLLRKFLAQIKQMFVLSITSNETDEKTGYISDGSKLTISVLIIAALATIGAVTAVFYGIYHSNSNMVVIASICYLGLALLGNDSVKKILFLPASVVSMICVLSLGSEPRFYAVIFYSVSLAYILFYKGVFRIIAVPVLLWCLAYTLFSKDFSTSIWFDTIAMTLLLFPKTYKIIRLLAPLFALIVLMHIVDWLRNGFTYNDDVKLLFDSMVFIVAFKPKLTRLYPVFGWIAISFNLLFILYLIDFNPPSTIYYTQYEPVSVGALREHIPFLASTVANTTESIHQANQALGTPTVKGEVDRPLSFIEIPVSSADKQTIRIGTSALILFNYLYKTIFPYPMSFYYGYKVITPTSITSPVPAISLLLYFGLALLGILMLKRNRLVAFSIFFYLLSIAVFSNYFYPVPGVMGDRFLFIPSLGWCIVLPVLLLHLLKIDIKTPLSEIKIQSPVFRLGLGAVLIVYSAMTFGRNLDWKNDLSLFRHDIEHVDQSAQAHNLLAIHLIQNSLASKDPIVQKPLREEAAYHFKKAIEIYPSFFNFTYDLARTYSLLNMQDSAVVYFKKAIPLNPDFTDTHLAIAEIYMGQGRLPDAIPYLQFTIKKRPGDYTAYDRLSYLYFRMNEYAQSIDVNKQAILAIPGSPQPFINLGRTFMGMNNADSARYYLQKANELSPGNQLVQQLLQQVKK